jgi:TolB-like protein/DNA-binding winged helix-turn-helix (wHTH) protein
LNPKIYKIGDLFLDPGIHEVSRDGVTVPLPPLSFDLLLALARRAPNLVSSEELEKDVWPGLVVSPGTIVKRVGLLREALGDDAENPRYVSVVRGRGYRLVPPVSRVRAGSGKSRPGKTGGQAARTWRKKGWAGLALLAGVALAIALASSPWDWRDEGETDRMSTVQNSSAEPSQPDRREETPGLSIAVLPFLTLTEEKDDTAIANGLSEEIINLLAGMKSLKVVARTSSFTFNKGTAAIDEIARTLNVNHILEGSVQRHGKQIRVTAQLIDARTGYHLWSEKYDRPFTDILAVQDDIALNIASALELRLNENERPNSAAELTSDTEAYALYLQGRNLLHQRMKLGGPGLDAALSSFENAIREDPGFARAWAGMGTVLWLRPAYRNYENRVDDHLKAEEVTRKALALDPDLSEAQAVLGNLAWKTGRFKEARTWYDKAMQQPAQDSDVRLWAGIFLDSVGYTDEAFRVYSQANRLDPFNQNLVGFLARSYWLRGKPEMALSLLRTMPESIWKSYSHAMAKLAMGDLADARGLLSGNETPYGKFPVDLVNLVFDALSNPEIGPEAEGRILESLESGELTERVAFELLWIMASPAMLDLSDELTTGFLAMRISPLAWGAAGAEFRKDEQFREWVYEVGLPEFWKEHGWPGNCRATEDGMFVCP